MSRHSIKEIMRIVRENNVIGRTSSSAQIYVPPAVLVLVDWRRKENDRSLDCTKFGRGYDQSRGNCFH